MVPRLWSSDSLLLFSIIVAGLGVGYWWAFRLPSPLTFWRNRRRR